MPSSALLLYQNRSHIRINGRVWIGNFSIVLTAPTKEVNTAPLLTIGDNTYIGDQVNIRAAGGTVSIGCNVLIANHVTIVSANHGIKLGTPINKQTWDRGDVVIGDDVWIAAGVTILPGAVHGDGSVIAAGAVVKGSVPDGAIYGGVPAREIGVRR
jgi:acetyltransferase-like isoleucine patch superfamily enzyme